MATTAFPTGGREIVEQMTHKFPDLFVNDDDKQRVLTERIGQQFAFAFGTIWGNKKRAGLSDDFRSKDSVAVRESDGTTSVWDMFSSGLDILVHDGDLPVPGSHANLPPSEATFMPCQPKDWLNGNVNPDPPLVDTDLKNRVTQLERDVQQLQSLNSQLENVNSQLQDSIAQHRAETAALAARMDRLEADAALPLKVIGKSAAAFGHQHLVNLNVTRG